VRAAAPDSAAKTRNLLIIAAAVLVVLIGVTVFVLMRGNGQSAGGGETAARDGERAAPQTTPTPPPTPPAPETHGTGTTGETGRPTPPAPAATGSIEVATVPTSARISVDGAAQSKRSNATLGGIAAGDVEVRVEKDGYLPQTRTVRVPADGTVRASFTLEPNPNVPGVLEIRVSPYATYYIDDQQVATNVGTTRQQVRPGIHSIRAVHPAFDPHEWKNIRVEPGKTVALSFDFLAATVPATSTLRVTADPWAEVVVDGQKTGKFTPCELQLSSGSHTVSVTRDGFVVDGAPQTVTLRGGPPTNLAFRLKKKP
jgi:hypothetical protein